MYLRKLGSWPRVVNSALTAPHFFPLLRACFSLPSPTVFSEAGVSQACSEPFPYDPIGNTQTRQQGQSNHKSAASHDLASPKSPFTFSFPRSVDACMAPSSSP